MKRRKTESGRENASRATRSKGSQRATASSNARADPVASLHRAVGNQAVRSFVENGRRDRSTSESAHDESEGDQLTEHRSVAETAVQPKLAVSGPTDRCEREADRVAEQVMRTSTPEPESGPVDGIQRRSTGGEDATVEGETKQQAESIKGGGKPLSPSARAFFEPRFGHDFSDVRVHTDSRADAASRSLNAEAFTLGRHIAFRSDRYRPDTADGKRLLAHELAHTVQQGATGEIRSSRVVQRLIKDDHPWTGAVVDTSLLALRDDPQVKEGEENNTLADLPTSTLVTVLDTAGQWLDLEVDTSQEGIVLNQRGRRKLTGNILPGYAYHEYIDDAVAAEMSGMVGEQATWTGSGPAWVYDRVPSDPNTFVEWAAAPSEAEAPPLEETTAINCWEMILLAAYRSGAADWQSIHDMYTQIVGDPDVDLRAAAGIWNAELEAKLTSGSRTKYDESTEGELERGDIVFFNGTAHVTLATGNGDEVLTFWPPPNTEFTRGGTLDEVKTSTIGELKEWMEDNMHVSVDVTFASPDWQSW